VFAVFSVVQFIFPLAPSPEKNIRAIGGFPQLPSVAFVASVASGPAFPQKKDLPMHRLSMYIHLI
jgi:hypothetical protein